jgi:uncharacterized protein YbjT (DUF2867 family)
VDVLLTGASGHVGGRLLAELELGGHQVRALSRNPDRLETGPATRPVRGDVNDRESLLPALEGADVAYYLVHSLDASSFAADDRAAAETFAAAAAESGVGRVVYLGGLGADGEDLSEHLASRQEVGAILRGGDVPAIELRASILIGAGSLSFELVRSVVESLPVVPLPDWTKNESQPIATDDVVQYLLHAGTVTLDESRVYEIGGADRMAYLDLLELYADVRGLSRTFVPLPVPVPAALLSPTRAPGEWLAGLAPERARAAAALLDSLRFATVADDAAALRDFPVRPRGAREAIERELERYSSA